jgi:protein-S-isoprenylcysteine O-methyltransferase Ste14
MRFAALAPSNVDIGAAQTNRRSCLLLTVAFICIAFIFSNSRWPDPLRTTIEWIGLALLIVCIGGRTWCALYIGGRQTRELVTAGPYSLCRNPLYLFSIVGAVGVGAQLGTISIAVLAGFLTWAAHVPAVTHEERRLLATHGERYRDYLARVPRFLPQLSDWQNAQGLEARPRAVTKTFIDACWFLVAVPIAALTGHLQSIGAIPALIHLP